LRGATTNAGFTVHSPRAGNTRCIGKRGESGVDSRGKPNQAKSVMDAGLVRCGFYDAEHVRY
jgi:hypothetical protein